MSQEKSSHYFQRLNTSLKKYKQAIPRLLIDLDALDRNLEVLRGMLQAEVDFRIVVKSLPCPALLDYIMTQMQTKRLMVFHQPFLSDIASTADAEYDILLGKPMPIQTAKYFYQTLPANKNNFDPFRQIQWLIDTDVRLEQYLELAQNSAQKLRINLELDIGLHRGGIPALDSLRSMLRTIEAHPDFLELSGLMGYDPHVVKLPKIIRSQQKAFELACAKYEDGKALIKAEFPQLWRPDLTFNGAGSPTLPLHYSSRSPLNDISAGSCLVKPTTFDIPTLAAYEPACYISTPVLKKFEGTTIPAIEPLKGVLNWIDASNQQSYFIYGGYWKADYHYPPGLRENKLFGVSTNQSMLNAPLGSDLAVDDFVFLRPQQSEFVFLQFGNLLAIRNQEVVDEWQLLSEN